MLYKAKVYIPRGGEGAGFYWSYKSDDIGYKVFQRHSPLSGSGEGSGRGSQRGSGLGQGYARKASKIPTPTQIG